ncbi:MAG: GNAT family N-acetyltransferase [Armatimonadota bacterium]
MSRDSFADRDHQDASEAALAALDRHYAAEMGCQPEDLRGSGMIIVASEHRNLRFAKGFPLPVFGMDTGEGCVISVAPHLAEHARDALLNAPSCSLSDEVCEVLENALALFTAEAEWFRGERLYLIPGMFRDREQGDVREASALDEKAAAGRRFWGGPVFAQFVDGRAVSRATVKPLSDVAWDLSIETEPEYRGRGYALSAVSAAVKEIFRASKIAMWGTDRTNEASLRTARALGFRHYAWEVGCFVR